MRHQVPRAPPTAFANLSQAVRAASLWNRDGGAALAERLACVPAAPNVYSSP